MYKFFWQYILPQRLITKIFGYLAHSEQPWLKNALISWFVRHYKINMQDALEPNPYNYKNLKDFFIREPKPEARPFPENAKAIASPVDGKVSAIGKITDGRIFQAKGHDFSAAELLADESYQNEFLDGDFITIYLAPVNYHRVYMPVQGELEKAMYIPGRMFAVNQRSAEEIPSVFARNERLVLIFKTEFGTMAMVLVGALIVAGLATSWAGPIQIASSPKNAKQFLLPLDKKITLQRGVEAGYFTFGSTVILLFPPNKIEWNKVNTVCGNNVKFGMEIATAHAN